MDVHVAGKITACPADPSLRRKAIEAVTTNVSARGLRLRTEHDIPRGSTVVLQLDVNHGGRVRTLRLKGEVVWSERVAGDQESFLLGVLLAGGRRRDMQVWTDTIFEEIRLSHRS